MESMYIWLNSIKYVIDKFGLKKPFKSTINSKIAWLYPQMDEFLIKNSPILIKIVVLIESGFTRN